MLHRRARRYAWSKPLFAVVSFGLVSNIIRLSGVLKVAADLWLAHLIESPSLFNEYALQLYMHERRRALINDTSVINYQQIYAHFRDDMEMVIAEGMMDCKITNTSTRDKYLKIFTDPKRGDIISGNFWDTFCCGAYGFFATGGIKKHVSMHPWDSNWGEFSQHVPNRTCDWGGVNQCYDEESGDNLMWRYLNHTNLSAVFTIQHQFFDHPKVFSMPLGQQSNAAEALQTRPFANRTNLLLISNSESDTRTPIIQQVISNFNGTVSNRYNDGSDYFEQMRSSMFVLCPSGLGWDTYRGWEALILGTIPILETYYRKDGMFRAYYDLPVLWVDHYDNVTPELLKHEYPRILSLAKNYTFEKLTNQWWIDLVNSYRDPQSS